jgi:hypothetical protein
VNYEHFALADAKSVGPKETGLEGFKTHDFSTLLGQCRHWLLPANERCHNTRIVGMSLQERFHFAIAPALPVHKLSIISSS